MQDSLFTKIINGSIPAYKIYEDDQTVAFLDIYPITPGHVLVVPKKQVEFLWDMDDDAYTTLLLAVKKIAQHLRTTLDVPYVGEQVIGVDVPHAHIHLIPFTHAKDFHNNPDTSGEPDMTALAVMAEKLRI